MDSKAKKILINTHWTSGRWRDGEFICSDEDFQYAKSKGLMFDPVTISHDECVQRLKELHEMSITKEKVARAFLHSLSTRKVYWRSALSSYALTHDLSIHTYAQRQPEGPAYSACGVCNANRLMADEQYTDEDWNVLNFERVKWGGVRLNYLIYCLMDLEILAREEEFEVSEEDVAILRRMLEAAQACGDGEAARQLEKRWKDILPSNQNERDTVMEIWGFAGLLQSQNDDRPDRGRGTDFVSMATWRGEDGYIRERVEFFFGEYL
ncbi:hypothetical protein EJP77_10950 [Paenibacillus zeisoli]|uniref:Uncharacterized protein n=1 Tax=Paenibacillus zeisoli TaxID=2496267 RepID=A0A3S1D9I1_9BACL|nr:hypothetical protein [Paenibacillus zeisoli]RUT31887.1 hypothetical protein EJP77_10950 [Paenibacillus zeisoli]